MIVTGLNPADHRYDRVLNSSPAPNEFSVIQRLLLETPSISANTAIQGTYPEAAVRVACYIRAD